MDNRTKIIVGIVAGVVLLVSSYGLGVHNGKAAVRDALAGNPFMAGGTAKAGVTMSRVEEGAALRHKMEAEGKSQAEIDAATTQLIHDQVYHLNGH